MSGMEPHLLHNNPEEFLARLQETAEGRKRLQRKRVEPVSLDSKKPEGHTRFVCISDTHNKHRHMRYRLPPGDVLLHCGDFTNLGKQDEVEEFNKWLESVPHKHKIVIAGNHELSFDPRLVRDARKSDADGSYCRFKFLHTIPESVSNDWSKVLSNCVYLEDAEISVNGIRIYGVPWNPQFGGWAFNLERGKPLNDKWNKIPGDGIDILMTHSPPAGYNDTVSPYGMNVGCVDLLNAVQLRVKPKYHIYGHIHEAYGLLSDGERQIINCTTVDLRHNAVNKPVIIDIPNPPGAREGLGTLIQH